MADNEKAVSERLDEIRVLVKKHSGLNFERSVRLFAGISLSSWYNYANAGNVSPKAAKKMAAFTGLPQGFFNGEGEFGEAERNAIITAFEQKVPKEEKKEDKKSEAGAVNKESKQETKKETKKEAGKEPKKADKKADKKDKVVAVDSSAADSSVADGTKPKRPYNRKAKVVPIAPVPEIIDAFDDFDDYEYEEIEASADDIVDEFVGLLKMIDFIDGADDQFLDSMIIVTNVLVKKLQIKKEELEALRALNEKLDRLK